MAVLMREAIGGTLRRARTARRRTLREVSRRARVSLGYLSEVERGRKEASSELLAAICAALNVSLAEVLREVSADLAGLERRAVAGVGPAGVPLFPSRLASELPGRAADVRVAIPAGASASRLSTHVVAAA
jgi:transcriptional regulator with XRE-family HTH domain